LTDQPQEIKPNWNKIKAEYVESDIGQRPLAKKYNVSFKTLTKRASDGEWLKQRKEFKAILSTKTIEKSAEKLSKEINKIKEEERKDVNEIRKVLKKRLTDENLSPKDVNSLSSALEKLQRVLYKSFGIADKMEVKDTTDYTEQQKRLKEIAEAHLKEINDK
jgi:hypothetical protein